MSSVEASRQHTYNELDDLSRDIDGSRELYKGKGCVRIPLCPKVIVTFFAVPVPALIDTGSQITAISWDFYEYLSLHGKLTEFPVSKVVVTTAIGKKPTTIRKQIWCEIHIGDEKYQSCFLVVPGLSNSVILGNDWFLSNQVVIDYEHISITVARVPVPKSLISFDGVPSRRLVVSKKEDDISYIQIVRANINEDVKNPVIEIWRDQESSLEEATSIHKDCKNDAFSVDNICTTKNTNTSETRLEVQAAEDLTSRSLLDCDLDCGSTTDDYFGDLFNVDRNNVFFMSNYPKLNEENIQNVNIINEVIPENEAVCEKILYEDNLVNNNYEDSKFISVLDMIHECYNKKKKETDSFLDDIRSCASGLTSLSDGERKAFVELMSNFRKLFSPKVESAKTEPYKIKIKENKMIVRKTYPIPFTYRESVDKAIEDMLRAGIIEKSHSSYCNPLRIVVKNDKSVRVCLDARYINEIIEAEHESPPLINELMQKFYGVSYMSLTDLATGYWQIPLHESSRGYTAFLHNSKMYQFCRIPFGLKTAGSAFIRALNMALGNQFEKILTVYIDDLLIATSGSIHDHLEKINSVFSILQEKNFTLKLDKSIFCQTKVNFLGYELSIEGVKPIPDRLEFIKKFSKPENKVQLQRFIGVCTYYRQFTVRHSNLLEPFRDLLKEKKIWIWTDDHDQAFENMKQAFVDCIKLNHFIPGARYKLQTDASNYGISGILYQHDRDNNHRIVSLVSRCLNAAELNYTTTEKELLAIVYSVVKLRTYLIGAGFDIITDHKALTFLNSTAYLNARLIRWSIILQQYDFTVSHCTGKDNIVADFFSRNPEGKFETIQPNNHLSIDVLCEDSHESGAAINNLDLGKDLCESFESLEKLQSQDHHINKIIKRVKEDNSLQMFTFYKNILFRKNKYEDSWQVVIPEIITRQLIDCVHSKLGHPGVYKTTMYLRQHYYWKSMNRDIKQFVLSCDLCQRVKNPNIQMECQYNFVNSQEPNDLIAVDFYGPLPRSSGGVEYIFVVLDVFTKYVKLYPIKRATTEIVLKKLFDLYMAEMGKPKRVLSDHGTQFTSPIWEGELRKAGIRVIHSSIRHPKSNPVERVMKELGRMFRTLCSDKHTRWAKCVSDIEYFLNITTHFSTGFTPFELHFGIRPTDQIRSIIDFPEEKDLIKDVKIVLAKEKLNSNFKRRIKAKKHFSRVVLREGDWVLLRIPKQSSKFDKVTHKFFHIFFGPYQIIKDFKNNSYELADVNNPLKCIGVHNHSNLKKYVRRLDA